jgi:hypothetical protein
MGVKGLGGLINHAREYLARKSTWRESLPRTFFSSNEWDEGTGASLEVPGDDPT